MAARPIDNTSNHTHTANTGHGTLLRFGLLKQSESILPFHWELNSFFNSPKTFNRMHCLRSSSSSSSEVVACLCLSLFPISPVSEMFWIFHNSIWVCELLFCLLSQCSVVYVHYLFIHCDDRLFCRAPSGWSWLSCLWFALLFGSFPWWYVPFHPLINWVQVVQFWMSVLFS